MKPVFTVVLPVRNGGKHLKECVASVLAQNFADFELAILENCSDDGSREWLETLRDPRVRIYPALAPLCIEDNWARAVEVPKNEFVTFIGHDDLLDPDYLDVMSALIAAHPDAALYHAHFRFIDTEGQLLGPCRPMSEQESAAEFTQAFLRFERDANGTGYVLRAQDFHRVGGFPHFHRMLYADHALWLSIVGNSFVVTALQQCFSYRLHLSSTSASARWPDQLQAIRQFIAFIKQLQTSAHKTSDEVQLLIQKLAPTYFFLLCQNWYAFAIVQATKRNERIAPEVFEEFVATLRQIAPEEVERLRSLKMWRSRRAINAFWLGRSIYILYILLRYGKGDLPSKP